MLKISSLSDMHGNRNIINLVDHLLLNKSFPHFAIISGPMGVGKTSLSKIIAKRLVSNEENIKLFNMASADVNDIIKNYLKYSPVDTIVLMFEELHALDRKSMTEFLTVIDSLPKNVYILATTTEIYHIAKPIVSRAIKFELKLLSNEDMRKLLESYAVKRNYSFSEVAANALLYYAHGIPRDLIKTADIVIDSDCCDDDVIALTNYVSDNFLYTIFSSLKSSALTFSLSIDSLIGDYSGHIIPAMRDFWVRFVLASKGATNVSIDSNFYSTLINTFSAKDRAAITDFLLKVTDDKLILGLLSLNIKLTETNDREIVGSQISQKTINSNDTKAHTITKEVKSDYKLTKMSLLNRKGE